MSPRNTGRVVACTPADGLARLQVADSFLQVAELILEQPEDDDLNLNMVAAALSVLAGIAASDAACCSQQGQQVRGQNHALAVQLLKTVAPSGEQMAKDLSRLLDIKDAAHYGKLEMARDKAQSSVGWAKRMTQLARSLMS